MLEGRRSRVDRDDVRSKKMQNALVALAYSSLFCFFAGLLIAGLNFRDVTTPPKEKPHERTEATPTGGADAKANAAARTAEPSTAAEPGPKNPNTERATTGPGSPAAPPLKK